VERDEDGEGGGEGTGMGCVEVGFEGGGPVLGGLEDCVVEEGGEV